MAILTTTHNGLNFTGGTTYIQTGTTTLMSIAVDGSIAFNEYGAGYLKTDASGNITADNTGGGLPGGPYLPLSAGSSYPLTGKLYAQDDIYISGEHVVKNIDTNLYLDSASGYNVLLRPGGSEKVRINSQGQLLINATSSGYSNNDYGYMLGVKGTTSQAIISVARSNQTLDMQGMLFGLNNSEGFVVNRDNSPLRFHTNDLPRMTISASGNVGIGTTGPSAKLHVVGKQMITTGANAFPQTEDYLFIGGDGLASANASIYIGNRGDGTGYGWRMFYEGVGSGVNNKLKFKSENLGNPIDVITMLQDGNVGIGTTSPTTPLQVAGIAQIVTGSDNAFYGGNYVRVFGDQNYGFRNTGGTYIANISMSGNSYFNGGNVGIGTTSPQTKLDVRSSDAGNLIGRVYNSSTSSTSSSAFRIASAANNANSSTLQFSDSAYYTATVSGDRVQGLVFRTSGSGSNPITIPERMRITPDGNVGIGTASPVAKLHVLGTSSDNATTKAEMLSNSVFSVRPHSTNSGTLAIAQVDNGNSVGMQFTNGSGTSNWDISMQPFGGLVGIGTTTPGAKLDIEGAANLLKLTHNNGYIEFVNTADNARTGYLQLNSNSSSVLNVTVNQALHMATNNTNRLTISSGGNVGIGTTSPTAAKLVVDSNTAPQILVKNSGGGNAQILFEDNSGGTQNASITYDQSGDNALSIATEYDSPNDLNKIKLVPGGEVAMTLSGGDDSTGTNGIITFNGYVGTRQTGTPTYILGTDASGNVVKTQQVPGVSAAASLYELIPNGAFTTTYSFTSVAGVYSEVMEGNDVITSSGTYSVQIYVHDHAAGGTQYHEYYSGVMSWFATGTNDAGGGAVSEIALHRAGHAGNQGMIYLRTRETTNAETNKLKLEIMCNRTYTSASNVVFKFVRLI